jgi:hypothetical protein
MWLGKFGNGGKMTREDLEKLAMEYSHHSDWPVDFYETKAYIAGALMMRDKIVDWVTKENSQISDDHYCRHYTEEIKKLGEDKF